VARGAYNPRSGVPWWTPLLGLVLLVVGVAAGVVATRSPGGQSASTRTAAVLGARAAVTRTTSVAATTSARTTDRPARRSDRSLTAAGRPLLPASAAGLRSLVGRYAHARSVRVAEVVGDRVFWIGRGTQDRVLVHLQGSGTRWAVRRGQRLSFTGVVTKNPARAVGAWGITWSEGRGQLVAQRYHLEVFGPRIRFVCAAHCGAHGR
jgi:hypothetical protein